MVAVQRQEQSAADAEQRRVLADAENYAAQKKADAQAYEIKQLAIAQQESLRLLMGELSQHPAIADKYLDYLMTQELRNNSKWVLGGSGTPIINLGPDSAQPAP